MNKWDEKKASETISKRLMDGSSAQDITWGRELNKNIRNLLGLWCLAASQHLGGRGKTAPVTVPGMQRTEGLSTGQWGRSLGGVQFEPALKVWQDVGANVV